MTAQQNFDPTPGLSLALPADPQRPAWGDWYTFSPLAPPERELGLPQSAFDLLGKPVAWVVTGTELLGGGIVPGDTLIVDYADRDPQPGALIVVRGTEEDHEPRDPANLPPSMRGLSETMLAQFTPCREVAIVGQYWPRGTARKRGNLIDVRALLPGYPAPLGIFDYAFADLLIGVVAGVYATGSRDDSVDWEMCDWSGWDWSGSIDGARRHMKALDAMIGHRSPAAVG